MNTVIHAAVRRDIGRFQEALRYFPVGSQARAEQLAAAWRLPGRDAVSASPQRGKIFWPALRELGVDEALVGDLGGEHDRMADAMTRHAGGHVGAGRRPEPGPAGRGPGRVRRAGRAASRPTSSTRNATSNPPWRGWPTPRSSSRPGGRPQDPEPAQRRGLSRPGCWTAPTRTPAPTSITRCPSRSWSCSPASSGGPTGGSPPPGPDDGLSYRGRVPDPSAPARADHRTPSRRTANRRCAPAGR